MDFYTNFLQIRPLQYKFYISSIFINICDNYLSSLLTILLVTSDLFCLTRCADSTVKTEEQLLPPSAVKEEEIDPLGEQDDLGFFQVDKLEEVTESLLSR